MPGKRRAVRPRRIAHRAARRRRGSQRHLPRTRRTCQEHGIAVPAQQAVYRLPLGCRCQHVSSRQARSGVSPGHCEIGAAIYRTLGLVPPNWVRLFSPVWPTHQGILTDAEELNAPAGAPQGEAAAHFGKRGQEGVAFSPEPRPPASPGERSHQAGSDPNALCWGRLLADRSKPVGPIGDGLSA